MSSTPIQSYFKRVASGDVAAVQKAVDGFGLEVCGGADAFVCAAEEGHTQVLDVLSEAGVRDAAEALMRAISLKQRSSIKFLVRQYERHSLTYLQGTRTGVTILFKVLEYFEDCFSPKLAYWLIESGVNLDTRVALVQGGNIARRYITARELVSEFRTVHSRESVPTLYAIERTMKQQEAVQALSWLWPSVNPKKRSQRVVVRIVRNRTARVALRGLLRYMEK